MPELPEVETVKNVLAPHLIGRTIADVDVFNASVIARPAPSAFSQRLRGQSIAELSRRGKFLTLHLADGDSVVLHLRMTGCLTIEPKDTPTEKHTHVVFTLDDGNELRYEDTRRFGRFWLIEKGEDDAYSGKAKLGIEPFAVTDAYLRLAFGASKKPVKALLIDQSILAGIGNIYADEICFAAGVRPDKAGNALTDDELSRLCAVIPERLTYFIEKNEIEFDDYIRAKGREYRNTPFLQVYGRANQPCSVCGMPLIGQRLSGRSNVYCPHCQK